MLEMWMGDPAKEWNGAAARAWLESRVDAARADQVAAERQGWACRDDCDMASAEEMVCTLLLRTPAATDAQAAFAALLKALLARDDYVWRGVYDERRFDRHARATLRKLMKMTKVVEGFGNVRRYQ